MNKYKAFYKGKTLDVESDSSYHAQLKASELFKARKSYDVTVVLCEVDNRQVIHTPDF